MNHISAFAIGIAIGTTLAFAGYGVASITDRLILKKYGMTPCEALQIRDLGDVLFEQNRDLPTEKTP